MASLPRWRWQTSAVNRVLEATCSQCSRPATRSPVSSTCTNSDWLSAARAAAVNGSSPADARTVQAATVPTDIGVPNTSASSPAVRPIGGCWPNTRYTAIAAACGPYCAGALTPAGPAAAGRMPHSPQPRDPSRASTTRTVIFADVEHLPADHPGRSLTAGQRDTAAGAGTRLVDHHLI